MFRRKNPLIRFGDINLLLVLSCIVVAAHCAATAAGQGAKSIRPNSRSVPAAELRPMKLKVLVLNYDPFYQGARLHEVLKLNDPRELAQGFLSDVKRSTKGLLEFEIVEWRDLDQIYAREDGGIFNVDDYVRMRRAGSGWPEEIVADYPRIIREQNVVPRIDDGSVDEVWIFCDHYFGVWEASMAGPGAFNINGGVYPEVPSVRPFAFYGFNYERGVAEMLHNTAHRIEATMNRTYGDWNLAQPRNNWELFSANADQSNGVAGVGTCHWPANAQGDYDYGNRRIVMSYADDFLNYPNLSLAKKPVSALSWSSDGVDPHRDYMNWYLQRLPKASGVNPDGKLNNWLPYIFDFQNYDPGGKALPNAVRVVKCAAKDTQFAVNISFSTAAGLDPSRIKAKFASLRIGDQDYVANRVHLVNADAGTYRTASFIFRLPRSQKVDGAVLKLDAGPLVDFSGVPFDSSQWTITGTDKELYAVPVAVGRETPLEVATWILENEGKVGLKGQSDWIERIDDLSADAAAQIERISWWGEGKPLETLKWHEIAALKSLTELRELELRGHQIGDRACPLIADLKGLRVLNLHACGISDSGLADIASLEHLERLDVGYSQGRISDAGASHLADLVNLQYLNIYDSSITDKFLRETLPDLKQLRSIELTSTRVTDQGVKALQRSNPACQVIQN